MNTHLSYIIETNGDNGIYMEWSILSHAPENVQWVEGVNSFNSSTPLPDPEILGNPEYIRKENSNEEYEYYVLSVVIPSKSSTFLVSVLVDGAESEGYFFNIDGITYVTITKEATVLNVALNSNLSNENRECVIKILSTQYGDELNIHVLQEYTPVQLLLKSYVSNGSNGVSSGNINSQTFEHTFYWLTSKLSPNSETLAIDVLSTGPRNGFIIRDVSIYVYIGDLDNTYTYSVTTDEYYETVQKCINGVVTNVNEKVIYNANTDGIYRKANYEKDLKVIKKDNLIEITNYGRCFLQDDAYYVITLSNVDDLRLSNTIIIKYETDIN